MCLCLTIFISLLVGGLEHFFIFPYFGTVIIPTDELIFFRGVGLNHQADYIFLIISIRILKVPDPKMLDEAQNPEASLGLFHAGVEVWGQAPWALRNHGDDHRLSRGQR